MYVVRNDINPAGYGVACDHFRTWPTLRRRTVAGSACFRDLTASASGSSATAYRFQPARAEAGAGVDDKLIVHHRGDGWAEVTEGNKLAWERKRYMGCCGRYRFGGHPELQHLGTWKWLELHDLAGRRRQSR